MTTCAGCGHATGPSDRFCPRCGLPIGAVDGLEDLPPVSDSPQWSDTVDDGERRVRRNPAGRLRRRAVASSILVGAAALTWMAVRSPTTPVFGLTDELAGPPTTSAEVSSAGGDRPAITGLAAGQGERTDGAVVVDPGRLDPALADYRLLAARDSEFFTVSSDRPSVSSAVVDEDGILQLTTTDTSAETPLSIMTRIDRSTGVRITRPTPAFRSGYVLGRRGRVAVGTGLDHTRFFDVRLARDVPIDDAFHETGGPWFVVEDLTDDDRFLVAVVGAPGNDVLIHDLDNRTDTRFELGRSSPLSRVLFVPKTGRR